MPQGNHSKTRENKKFRAEINRLLKKGVIVPVENNEKGFIFSVFFREKKDQSFRLILNLKKFNEYVTYRHFKMDNLKTALTMVRKNCFMASIDLSDAYYSVPVAASDQKYLFQSERKLYKFICLPNGLTSAPRLFTKILKPVFAALHKEGHDIMGYLDDSILFGDTFEECKLSVMRPVSLFQELGFQVHPEKSCLIQKQEIEFLGFLINSKNMTVKLTESKCQKISDILNYSIKNKNRLQSENSPSF